MIHVRTSTLCTIASELDDAMDKLTPEHAAFGSVMQARALFRIHILNAAPSVEMDFIPTPPDEPSNVDAAGTFQG